MRVFGIAVAAVVGIASAASAGAQDANERFVVYSGSYRSYLKDKAGIPIGGYITILVDTSTGRTWQLLQTEAGIRWDPVHFLPTEMAGDGKPLMGGTIVPQPIGGLVGQH